MGKLRVQPPGLSIDAAKRANVVSLADEQAVKQVLVDSALGLWEVVSKLSVEPPLANPTDLKIPRWVGTSDEAIALLRQHQQQWASSAERNG